MNGGWSRGMSERPNIKRYQIIIPAGLSTREVWTIDATYNVPFTKNKETRIFSYQVKESNIIPIK